MLPPFICDIINRWISDFFCSDKFLAFKTPLGPRYDANIPEANRFQLPMLFAYLDSLKVRVDQFFFYQFLTILLKTKAIRA